MLQCNIFHFFQWYSNFFLISRIKITKCCLTFEILFCCVLAQEFDDVITVSLPKSNELEHMEKDHGDNNMDYHVTNESIVDNNEGEDNLGN